MSRALRIGLLTSLCGLAGMGAGWLLHPESNLLGGFALVFGPLWAAGAVAVVVALVQAIAVRTKRRAAGRRTE